MARTARRPWPHRLTALFLAALFLLAGAREGIAGYVCAKHSDHGEHAAATADAHHGHAAHESVAGHAGHHDHGGHGNSAGPSSPGADPHGDGEPCSCIGDCQPGQTSVAQSQGDTTSSESFTSAAARISPAAAAFLPGAPKFFLPYSNGPPHLG